MTRRGSAEQIRLSHRLEALALRGGLGLLGTLSRERAIRVGARLGELVWRLGVRRRVVMENLAGTPDLCATHAEQKELARACYRNIGRVIADYARLPRLRSTDYRRIIRYEGLEHIVDTMKEGNGLIALSGHFGSLELMALSFQSFGITPAVIVAPMRNPLANQLFDSYRRNAGETVIPLGSSLRAALRHLRRGGFLCLAADQDAGRRGIFVDFLGRPASTATGPVELALRSGSPIVFGLIYREGLDRHVVRIRPPVRVEDQGGRDATLRHYTELFTRWLEEGVRRQPDHWFWLHRRWKTRPEAAHDGGHGDGAASDGALSVDEAERT